MRKLICCSFEQGSMGGFITINNGIHPDRNGHYSKTVMITKEQFNEACENRRLFSDILGVDITMGWQNALKDAISNCSNLKTTIDPVKMAETVIKGNIAEHGEEVVKKDMETLAEILEEQEKFEEELAEKAEKEAKKKKTTKKKVKTDGQGTETGTDTGIKVETGSDDNGISENGKSADTAE